MFPKEYKHRPVIGYFDLICIFSGNTMLIAFIQWKFWWLRAPLSCKTFFMAKRNWINCPFCRHRLFFVLNGFYAQRNAVRKTWSGPSIAKAGRLAPFVVPAVPWTQCFLFSVTIETREQKHCSYSTKNWILIITSDFFHLIQNS